MASKIRGQQISLDSTKGIDVDAAGKLFVRNGAGVSFDGSGNVQAGYQLLDLVNTSADYSGGTAETTIYTKNIPANTLGTTRFLRLRIDATYLNNTGGNGSITLKVKFGGTAFVSDTTPSQATGATKRKMFFDLTLYNAGATNAQGATLWFAVTPVGGGFGGALTSYLFSAGQGLSTLAIDTTANADLVVTVAFNNNTATQTFSVLGAQLELLG